MAIGGSLSVGLIGLKAFIIQIQAFISPGLPYFSVIGLPDASLSESRERVKSATPATRVISGARTRPLPKETLAKTTQARNPTNSASSNWHRCRDSPSSAI